MELAYDQKLSFEKQLKMKSEPTFLTTGRTQGLLSLSRYAPTPRLTLSLNVSTLYAADSLKMLVEFSI